MIENIFQSFENIFTPPELAVFFTEHPGAVDPAAGQFSLVVGEFSRQLLADGEGSESVEQAAGELLQSRMPWLQLADRQYWRDIIRSLKELREAGELMPDGKQV